jgi:hypothetical protein
VAAQAPQVNYTKEQDNLYQSGIAQTAARHAAVNDTEIGAVLKTKGTDYALADDAVVNKLLPTGANAQRAAQRYRAFVQGDPDAMGRYSALAARSLRNAAANADGTLRPKDYQKWMGQHAGLFESNPELRPAFANIGTAQEHVRVALAARETAIKSFEQSAAAHYLKNENPVDAINRVMAGTNAAKQARELMAQVGSSPAAVNGVKANAAAWVRKNILSQFANGETAGAAIKANTLRKTLAAKSEALRAILGNDSVNLMYRTLHDYERNDIIGSRRMPVGGNSPTSMNEAQRETANKAGDHSLAGSAINLAQQPLLALLAMKAHGLTGGMSSVLTRFFAKAAIADRDKIVDEALLNPPQFAHLLKKYPTKPAAQSQWLRRLSELSASSASRANSSPAGP